MEIEYDKMQLRDPIVVQSSLSSIVYMEDPIDHEPVYHFETFNAKGGIKRKGDDNLEDETPSKKQCEYKCTKYT